MVQNTQTTVTTRTTEQTAPLAPGVNLQKANVLQKDAIVTNVMEKPVLQNVIEKKNVEVHHKPVVQEIHEQKIIEIQKQPMMQSVQQPTLIQQERAATKFEEIGTGSLGEQERLRLQQLNAVQAPKITQTGGVRQVQEGEQVAQVVRQEFVERHVQPVITEVREQNIVQEVVHPVVRKVHEAPIVREVTSAPLVQQTGFVQQQGFQQGLTQQSGLSTTKTSTMGTGLSGVTTTTTTGMNPISSEQRNLGLHEQKLVNKGGMNTTERQNIAVHEQVVDSVVRGTGTTGANTQGWTSGTTTSGTHLGNEQKPGFMERVKDKLHIGHHHNTTTTNK